MQRLINIDMDNDVVIIQSFFEGKEIQISKLLHWVGTDVPQVSVLKRFLIETFPTLTELKDDSTWNLDCYEAAGAAEAMMNFYMNLGGNFIIPSEVNKILLSWITGGFFAFVPSQWHRCNNNCQPYCKIRENSIGFLNHVIRMSIKLKASNLYAPAARMAVLYQDETILASMKDLEFTFKSEIATSMFFSTVVRSIKMFVFNHSPLDFKNEILRVLSDDDEVLVTKNGIKFNSSEIYMHISDMIAILDPIEHMKFRAELEIKNLSVSDFISACEANNFPLVKSMLDASFPSYIRKREHLTQILRALSGKKNCPEWNSVFHYVVKTLDKTKAKLHVEDAICFMVRNFYLDKKADLSSITNWDRPPEFRNGSPLLYNFELLKELENNKKLALWCAKPRHSLIDVPVNHSVDPRCLTILCHYNLIGVFYH